MASPFKDVNLLENDLVTFINKFKTTVAAHSKKISDYFEMGCFNDVIRFYTANGYKASVQNLIKNEYRYKCSTAGIHSNFSRFVVTLTSENSKVEFEIHHNLAVQSFYAKECFTTPDITVINSGTAKTTTNYYDSNKRFSYVENGDVRSFCECKHYTPFPELIFSFIGVLNELRPQVITNSFPAPPHTHLAPSLLVSGKPTKQTEKIKKSLEKRYCINILYDLFYSGKKAFNKSNVNKLRVSGKNS